jgi:hypothetical protein
MCPSIMGFAQRVGMFFILAALVSPISCEKHHVGEYPEVQVDRTLEAKQQSEHGGGPAVSPTPVKFFPEKKSR